VAVDVLDRGLEGAADRPRDLAVRSNAVMMTVTA